MDFTTLQRAFVRAFTATPLVKRFYLTGGTLLAVRDFHHRRSLDMDFFTDTRFALADVERDITTAIRTAGAEPTGVRHVADRYTWTIARGGDTLKLDFVWYQFPALRPRVRWEGMLTDHLDDIGANKAVALFERHEAKDVFDLYYLLTAQQWAITTPLELMRKKFDLPITPATFFTDIEVALKRLDDLRGLLLIADRAEQDVLFGTIHRYFDDIARPYLRHAFDDAA